jgi:LytR cell envelope-related transcriptional attenuator
VTSPEQGGRSRPLRMIGLALLGVAVGAALVGVVTLSSGPRDGGEAIAPSPTTETATPTATDTQAPGQPTGPPGETTTTSPPPEAPPPPPPPQPTATAEPPASPAPPAPPPTASVRIYNNSTITGLAARAAAEFSRAGWPVEEVANYRGRIPTSTVYYQPGTGQEAFAQRLASQFDLRVEPRFPGIEQASPGLIVIVTNDYGAK